MRLETRQLPASGAHGGGGGGEGSRRRFSCRWEGEARRLVALCCRLPTCSGRFDSCRRTQSIFFVFWCAPVKGHGMFTKPGQLLLPNPLSAAFVYAEQNRRYSPSTLGTEKAERVRACARGTGVGWGGVGTTQRSGRPPPPCLVLAAGALALPPRAAGRGAGQGRAGVVSSERRVLRPRPPECRTPPVGFERLLLLELWSRPTCWGNGPAHVRVSGPLCGLEEFLVNNASTRGSEENNRQGLGGKSPSTPSLYI
jgi:hypothetical protein